MVSVPVIIAIRGSKVSSVIDTYLNIRDCTSLLIVISIAGLSVNLYDFLD